MAAADESPPDTYAEIRAYADTDALADADVELVFAGSSSAENLTVDAEAILFADADAGKSV